MIYALIARDPFVADLDRQKNQVIWNTETLFIDAR